MLERFGQAVSVIIIVPIIMVMVGFIGVYVLALLALMLVLAGAVVVADLPITVTKNDKKVGTWRRSTGFVPLENENGESKKTL